jgi:plastocyanin
MFTEPCRRLRYGRGARELAVTLGAAFLLAAGPGAARSVLAQETIRTPDVQGDQLIFFIDNRADRASFLSLSNPSDTQLMVEIAFYPESLAQRLGQEVVTLGPAANLVVDPTAAAGGVAAGQAGLAVVTPVDAPDNRHPIVPAAPLTGSFSVANTVLGAGFGENPFGRRAVLASGGLAAPGAAVDGTSVLYQRFVPDVLTVPVYFNPQTLGPASNDGNRVVLVAFNDQYGANFDLAPLAETFHASIFDTAGQLLVATDVAVNGIVLTDLQSLAGDVTLSSSGKVFFETGSDGAGANRLGIFSEALGTFAAGQRMPAVDVVPQGAGTPAPTPASTPTPTPVAHMPQTMTVMVGSGGFTFDPPNVTIQVGDTVHWVWATGGHNVVSGSGGSADGSFCSPADASCGAAPLLGSGATYDHTFTQAGSFPYFCAAHVSFGMVGTVTVQ